MIHVCYGLYDRDGRYSKFTGTSMLSVFENTTAAVTVHILHDNTLTIENRNNFIFLAERYNQTVNFYNVEKICADKIADIKKLFSHIDVFKIFSVATTYRLMISDIISDDITKMIYLDSDTIVNLDINELWRVELGSHPLAAVSEAENGVPVRIAFELCNAGIVKDADYFNAGVLLMNLRVLKNKYAYIRRALQFVHDNPENTHFDQDALNYCFAAQTLHLPIKFNRFLHIEHSMTTPENFIYHYGGYSLTLDLDNEFNCLWFEYFMRTPWFGMETIKRLCGGMKKIYVERQNFAIELSALESGKKRAFFVTRQDLENAKRIFKIDDSEEIIVADSAGSIKKLGVSMITSRGTKLFFILVGDDFGDIHKILTKAGFAIGRDFINGMNFLSDAHGVPLNSHPLVKML